MSAVVIATAFGGPEVLSVVDQPPGEPGPGEARIQVRAAGVNPVDWKQYSGRMGADPSRLPMRLGAEAAGVVTVAGPDAAGPAGPVRAGDEVIAFRAPGAYAADATEPIDSTEPAEPIDRIEPAEPMDRMEPVDPMLRIEPLDPDRSRVLRMIALSQHRTGTVRCGPVQPGLSRNARRPTAATRDARAGNARSALRWPCRAGARRCGRRSGSA